VKMRFGCRGWEYPCTETIKIVDVPPSRSDFLFFIYLIFPNVDMSTGDIQNITLLPYARHIIFFSSLSHIILFSLFEDIIVDTWTRQTIPLYLLIHFTPFPLIFCVVPKIFISNILCSSFMMILMIHSTY
jgi:hypothetical protein